jgi:hypothetical protein
MNYLEMEKVIIEEHNVLVLFSNGIIFIFTFYFLLYGSVSSNQIMMCIF